mmetsp:Transcript_13617/g.19969  ORF Transcript_13617/g.19969 Transcript_13617/m.19969 type:complete len:372 (-) Transcript_13617:366-1481(-)
MPVKIPLPTGSIGITFKGTPPTVTKIKDDSPLKARIKEGYIVEELLYGEGHEYSVPGAHGTSSIVKALKDSSEEDGRVIVMKIGLPDSKEVDLPEGDIKAKIKDVGGKATVMGIDSDSPVFDSLRVGYVVDKVTLDDGTELIGHTAEEIEDALATETGSTGRRLSLKDPKKGALSDRAVVLPMKKEVTVPPGKLGVVFKGAKMAKIVKISDTSPLKGIARVGMVVDSLKLPNGIMYSGYGSVPLTKALGANKDVEGRVLILKSPEATDLPTKAAIQVLLPKMGGVEELGIIFEGETTTIASISPTSALVGKIVAGQSVLAVNDNDGKEYGGLQTATKVEDAILDCSGCGGRYIEVSEPPPPPPEDEQEGTA